MTTTSVLDAARPQRTTELDPLVAPTADVLVFECSDTGFTLVGGSGRGAGWAGIVEVDRGTDSLVERAWQVGTLLRRDGGDPAQIVGPYHARHAVAVPVGQRHVVVFGDPDPIRVRDSSLVRWAAGAVDRIHGVSADKLLADELELVHVLRALMAYRPDRVRDTMRHVATVAATALSCEVAAIRVQHDGEWMLEAVSLDGSTQERTPAGGAAADVARADRDGDRDVEADVDRYLDATAGSGPIVEQAAPPESRLVGTDLASHIMLPLGTDATLGALALGHSAAKPRGFTSLCQRIGRAVAEGAELLITQAMAREQLAAERDLLARMSGTDALTGVGNRRAWDAAAADRADGHVLTCDLDGLKTANDRYGHRAGDALIRATANLLSACVREGDVVARVGGDEFAVLLRDTDRRGAVSVRARVRRAERLWRITEFGLTPRLSLGLAPIVDGDVDDARNRADVLMYANKRRRRRNGAPTSAIRGADRRR